MAHPFARMFENALRSSTLEDNRVHDEACKLLAKGYSTKEICGVLHTLERSLIDDTLAEIVREARTEVCAELEDDDDRE